MKICYYTNHVIWVERSSLDYWLKKKIPELPKKTWGGGGDGAINWKAAARSTIWLPATPSPQLSGYPTSQLTTTTHFPLTQGKIINTPTSRPRSILWWARSPRHRPMLNVTKWRRRLFVSSWRHWAWPHRDPVKCRFPLHSVSRWSLTEIWG